MNEFLFTDRNTIRDLVYYTEDDYFYTLTMKERHLILEYTLNYYTKLNYSLRNGIVTSDCLKLDEILDKFYFKKPIKVFRKLYIRDNIYEFMKSLDKGFIIDKAYQSTSLSNTGYEGYFNVLMNIEINNPNCGAYIAPFSMEAHELEFLVKRDTKLAIDNYEYENNVCYVKGKIK